MLLQADRLGSWQVARVGHHGRRQNKYENVDCHHHFKQEETVQPVVRSLPPESEHSSLVVQRDGVLLEEGRAEIVVVGLPRSDAEDRNLIVEFPQEIPQGVLNAGVLVEGQHQFG
jgi:hypothetical protein